MLDTHKPALNTAKVAGSSQGVRRATAQRYCVRGEWLSISEMSEKYGIQNVTIRQRLRRGITGDDLVANVQDVSARTYLVKGEELTRHQIAEKYGLAPMTVYTRIRLGWTGDDLARPLLRFAHNSGDL
jgi:uncharacterized protein YjcR